MKLLFSAKDGGLESKVYGFWLVESKKFGSIALLRFENGSREAYHSHAFESVSWLLKGWLQEEHLSGEVEQHYAGFRPIRTHRGTFHKVTSVGTSWILTFRGPWSKTWLEFTPSGMSELVWGRKVVDA